MRTGHPTMLYDLAAYAGGALRVASSGSVRTRVGWFTKASVSAVICSVQCQQCASERDAAPRDPAHQPPQAAHSAQQCQHRSAHAHLCRGGLAEEGAPAVQEGRVCQQRRRSLLVCRAPGKPLWPAETLCPGATTRAAKVRPTATAARRTRTTSASPPRKTRLNGSPTSPCEAAFSRAGRT
jgi:hypothetical protein